ncbi:hypothetical protein ACIP98_06125 [Streptomyces sp. NPDC088354]|uniref:hypothetical protein n=1 Tax=unclassified Streptomyces TaxID=2593676 RepID=UPI0029AE9C3B|nr:hypothetical protein [Streptomyces sp. MI02-7b]MDX3073849.1 hypothetical protein [Streptomyces sp. MI02-7b]
MAASWRCDVCGRGDDTVRDCGIPHLPLAVCDPCFADMARARRSPQPRPLDGRELMAALLEAAVQEDIRRSS